MLAVVCVAVFPLAMLWNHSHGKPLIEAFRLFFPLLFVGGASAYYTSHHVQALKDAIADPDPALDAHFAEMLVSDRESVAKLGREAFLQRFSERLPHLDEEGWDNVGWGLRTAPTDDAEALLALLARGAPASAIERIEDFRKETKVDRLRTASHAALAEIRLRAARDRVLEAVERADRAQTEEWERLRL